MNDFSNAAENPIGGVPEGMTPEEYLASPDIYKSKDYQMGVGIVIENYSKYNLMFPTVNFENAGKAKTEVKDVNSRSSQLFIFDNDYSNNNGNHGVFGTISWQVSNKQGDKATKTRLVLGFSIPWR